MLKTSEVTQFLRDLIAITMHSVDPEGYVLSIDKHDRLLIGENGRPKSDGKAMLLYQEEIKDRAAYLFNPMSEGLGQPPSSVWFYRALRVSIASRLFMLGEHIINVALQDKAGNKEGHQPSMEVVNICAKIIDEVDDKTLDEFRMLQKHPDGGEFLTIYYVKRDLFSSVFSALWEPEPPQGVASFRSKFPKIRKKSWEVFERLLVGMLGLKSDREIASLGRKSDDITCVRLSSTLNVTMTIFKQINRLLAEISDGALAIDLSLLQNHLTNLAEYVKNSRFMVPTNAAPPAATNNQVPGTSSQVPGAPSFNVGVPGTTPGGVPLAYFPGTVPGVPLAPTWPAPATPFVAPPMPYAPPTGYFGMPQPCQPSPWGAPVAQPPNPYSQPPFAGPYTTIVGLDNINQPGQPMQQPGAPGMPWGIIR